MSTVTVDGGREESTSLGWMGAAIVVAGLHVGVGWWLVTRDFVPPPPEGVAGVTIDLEPVAVPAPPTAEPRPMETAGPAPSPQVAEAPDAPPEASDAAGAPPPPPAEQARPVEQARPEPAPAPEAVPPPAVEPPPAVLPPPAAALASDAVLPPPPPKPVRRIAAAVPRKPVPPRPDPRAVAREEAREARDQDRQEARRAARAQAAAEARTQAAEERVRRRAARAATAREGGDRASAAPAASGTSVASWRGEVLAHLDAYKPSSPDGNAGTVRVAFAVDRGGRVVSASVSGSSGDGALDAAALSMVRRASPVPAPPPELGGHVSLAVPVNFH